MTPDEVTSVLKAASAIDPLAGLALRIAAVAAARRAEIAALRWSDLRRTVLTVDSSVNVIRLGESTELVDTRTKTAERHRVTLHRETVRLWRALQVEREEFGPYLFNLGTQPARPDRIGWWWQRARERSGVDKA
jgi:integrase